MEKLDKTTSVRWPGSILTVTYVNMLLWKHHVTSVLFFPEIHKLSLILRKGYETNSSIGAFCQISDQYFTNCQDHQKQEKVKKLSQPTSAYEISCNNLDQFKDKIKFITLKINEIFIQYGLVLIKIYQYCFINYNKCTMLLLSGFNSRINWRWCIWELCTVFANFLKSKSVLKYLFKNNDFLSELNA